MDSSHCVHAGMCLQQRCCTCLELLYADLALSRGDAMQSVCKDNAAEMQTQTDALLDRFFPKCSSAQSSIMEEQLADQDRRCKRFEVNL
jgi:hypothetical protein